MKKIYRTLLICMVLGLFSAAFTAMAGNRDRSGQSGAQHLLLDPWARSAGWASCGVAEIRGLESVYSNIAGLAFTKKTELAFSRTKYFTGSNGGININAAAVAQGLTATNKETGRKIDLGTIAISMYAMGFGDIGATTVAEPDGTAAIFSPKLNYIGIHYAKSFNNYIHGGISFKIVNESISDVRANGMAIDVGVQYLAGAYENFKIGVALKNFGLPMTYRGDGISIKATKDGTDYTSTVEERSAPYELPTQLIVGLSYDFLFFSELYQSMDKRDRKEEGLTRNDAIHRITLAGSFIANAYSRDNFAIGLEYGFMKYFQVRAGYLFENVSKKNIEGKDRIFFNDESIYIGPSAGITVGIPLSKKGNQQLYFDYAYKFTHLWKGNHIIGLKLAL